MNPFAILFLIFVAVPVLEIYLLIKVGGLIGALPTVGLVVFTAVLGAWLLRLQGLSTWMRVQRTLASGGLPAVEVLEGAVLLVGGALLLTPGFFTDTIGFLCLIPPVRQALIRWFLSRGVVYMHTGPYSEARRGPATLEGEWRREDEP